MANIKEVTISGYIPFNCYEYESFAKKLAFMNGPTTGLHIRYSGPVNYEPNEHGGRTAMYKFDIQGEEAVSWGWLDAIVTEIKEMGGKVEKAKARDIEDQGKDCSLI